MYRSLTTLNSLARKFRTKKNLPLKRSIFRQSLTERLESRVVFSGMPLTSPIPHGSTWFEADDVPGAFSPASLASYETGGAGVCLPVTEASLDEGAWDDASELGRQETPEMQRSMAAVDAVMQSAELDASLLADDTSLDSASSLSMLSQLGSASLPEGELSVATSDIVPAPFWKKVGNTPTYSPGWYANKGPVTKEVYYNTSLTAAENGASLARLLANLSAGDHVRIHAGTYVIDSWFNIQAAGTAQQPITIAGAAGENVVITRSDASQNVINLDNSQYLIMEGFTIRGGSTGLRVYTVNHFMLHDVEIGHTGNNGIAANSRNTSYLYFIDNHIHHTGGHGEGFYLGSHDGTIITHHTYVIGNYLHDLNGANVTQGDGIEVKDGSYAVTIKYNFIQNTKYPGIVVYRTGRGATDRNLIEENVVLHSSDVGIQATAEAIIRNNLVITNTDGFLSKPFGTDPRYLTVVNNTFVAGDDGVKTFNWGSTSNVFANNAIHSAAGKYITNGTGNAVTSSNVLVADLAAAFKDVRLDGTGLNAAPAAGSALIGTADSTYLPVVDLNGQTRTTGHDVGAVDHRDDATAVTPGVLVTPTTGLVTTESGAAASFTVQLQSQPVADVTIDLFSSDSSEGLVSTSRLTFTASNWNQPQTVTVTGVDDSVVDGAIAYTIVTAPAASLDPAYNGLSVADVLVTNSDNDGKRLRKPAHAGPKSVRGTALGNSLKIESLS